MKRLLTSIPQFHVLRRQIHRDFRKPVSMTCLNIVDQVLNSFFQLICFFSKSLLRHPKARSELSEMTNDTHFLRYLPDPHPKDLVEPEKIRRHILCSGSYILCYSAFALFDLWLSAGQIYYTLLQEREDKGITDVAISRLEQLSPFPYDLVCLY